MMCFSTYFEISEEGSRELPCVPWNLEVTVQMTPESRRRTICRGRRRMYLEQPLLPRFGKSFVHWTLGDLNYPASDWRR